MPHLCKHCATPVPLHGSDQDFCCSGCRQIYHLIQTEGLEDYYRWQDRATLPLKDRQLEAIDLAALKNLQGALVASVEGQWQVRLPVDGMSCMGCAWLIERVSQQQAGVEQAQANLLRNSLLLQWRGREFDLALLGAELYRFGYRLGSTPMAEAEASRLSGLALRCLLSLIFTGNALLLAAYRQLVLPPTERAEMIGLLGLVCLFFTLLIGGAPFFVSVYRALKIRRWHSDWLPVAMIASVAALLGFAIVTARVDMNLGVFVVASLVSILIVARWLTSLGRV